MDGKPLDIVYVVKASEINEELRYSLRSLKNIPHGKVFIAGYKPTWIRNVIHIPVQQGDQTKYDSSTRNLMRACQNKDLSKDFILMNDDFFIMKPIESIPTYHRGSVDNIIEEYLAKGSKHYVNGMVQTKELCAKCGINNPLSYELHVPMILNKDKFLRAYKMRKNLMNHMDSFHKRTFYGNLYKIGGEQIEDCKVFKTDMKWKKTFPFLSTSDATFEYGEVGKWIREQFTKPSIYECG